MFVDEAQIKIRAGKGGDGAMSFRHEKFVPKGGPDGGDGGNGGSVIFAVDSNANTLVLFRYKQQFKAENGANGQGARKHGTTGADLVIPVPPGTIVRDADTGQVLADLSEKDDRVVLARGGRGGRGNTRFATSTNQAPRRADKGQPGEEHTLDLELKVLADVGLVGFPNAGKSTLLSRVSAAHPKIACYPFTPLQPTPGIVRYGEEGSFVMADIPGIIEGAHKGKGLGFQFLRHIERTKVLLFLVEAVAENPKEQYRQLLEELAAYSPTLAGKPRLVAFTKIDLLPPDAPAESVELEPGVPVYRISAVTGEGVERLVYRLAEEVRTIARDDEEDGRTEWDDCR